MSTYWDDFLKEYPDAVKLIPVVMLEAFWWYCQGKKEEDVCRRLIGEALGHAKEDV
jgi:hypothetical protein